MKIVFALILLVSFSSSAQDDLKFEKFQSKKCYFDRSIDSTLLVGDTVILIKGKPGKGETLMNNVLFDKKNQFSAMKWEKWCKKQGRRFVMYAGAKLFVAGSWKLNEEKLVIISDGRTLVLRSVLTARKEISFVRET